MYAPLWYSLLVESIPWIEDPALQGKVTQATTVTHQRAEDAEGIHVPGCTAVDPATSRVRYLTLEEAWIRGCRFCPAPLATFLAHGEIELVQSIMGLAWALELDGSASWSHASVVHAITLEDAEGNGAAVHAPTLWQRVRVNRAHAQDQALSDPLEALHQEAALFMAGGNSGSSLTEHPHLESWLWDRLRSHWRRTTMDHRWEGAYRSWPQSDQEAYEHARVVLDQEYQALLIDHQPLLLGMHVGRLDSIGKDYAELLRSAGEVHQDHLYLQGTRVTLERLGQITGTARSLGVLQGDETPAVLETARCLHRDGFQPDPGEDILSAARMLNT